MIRVYSGVSYDSESDHIRFMAWLGYIFEVGINQLHLDVPMFLILTSDGFKWLSRKRPRRNIL